MDTGKRPYDSVENSEVERPLSFEARSVAIDLGMLSLHSDSRQKHYLGSSSALLFMKVIGAGAEVKASGPVSSFPATAHRRRVSSHRPSGEIYHSLYSSLKKVILTDPPVLLKFGLLTHAIKKGIALAGGCGSVTGSLFSVYPHRSSFPSPHLIN